MIKNLNQFNNDIQINLVLLLFYLHISGNRLHNSHIEVVEFILKT